MMPSLVLRAWSPPCPTMARPLSRSSSTLPGERSLPPSAAWMPLQQRLSRPRSVRPTGPRITGSPARAS
eukprot:11177201-Lingulodinium_polyedra.AAC.1